MTGKSVISTLWSFGSLAARALAHAGVLDSKKLSAKVVSIGNIQAGGSGKTPLVSFIAREATGRGKSVCVLTRGYGGSLEKAGAVIAPRSEPANPFEVGDEAVLLHEQAPEVWIAIGADRVAQYEKAVKQKGQEFDWVLLDDGFQHWKIKKDIELIAVTSRSREEVFFRDFSRELRHANLVVWTKGQEKPECLQNQSSIPWVKVNYRFSVPREAIGKSYYLVSAIADGGFFKDTALALGLKIVKEVSLPDHAVFSSELIENLLKQARKDGAKIAMTGKDWVKWRAVSGDSSVADLLVLEPELEFESGRELWEKVLWS